LHGGQGDDVLHGGQGDDILKGGQGDDILRGGQGNDQLRGGQGDDRLIGGQGDDRMTGGQGDDRLLGGDGDDTFIYNVGDGNDTIIGGEGKDTLHLEDTTLSQFATDWEIKDANGKSIEITDLVVDGKIDLSSLDGTGTITGSDGNEIEFKSLESISFAEGGPSDDILIAGRGDDTLVGGEGNDFLKGDQGDDTFVYNIGDGSDVVIGGQGQDDLHFGDLTLEKFSEEWQILDSEGNTVDLNEITVDGKIDLSSIEGNGTVVGPDSSEITVKSLETISFDEETKAGNEESGIIRVTVGEPTEVFSSSFEDKLQGGTQGNPSYLMSEVDGWQSSSESIEIWSNEMKRDLGALPDGKNTAAAGDQFIELNDVKSDAFKDADGIYREVQTEQGKVYELTFDYSGRPGYDASVNTFELTIGDTKSEQFNHDMSKAKDHDWQKVKVEFIGTGEPMKIKFQENSTNDHDYGRGISLDNIVLLDTGIEERQNGDLNSETTEPNDSLGDYTITSDQANDGLEHDGKITVTLGGEAYKGNPQYAILVDGKEVNRGEIDWSKDTLGSEKLYGNEGANDVDNAQVEWKNISVDYDFTQGMPKTVEVRFLNDACGGHDTESGEWQDRNLIVDKIKVDGLSVESEGDFTKYGSREGMERMPWQGTLDFNINQAYASHVENYQAASITDFSHTTPPSDAPDYTPSPSDRPSVVPTGADDGTIKGTQVDDIIVGTQGDDTIKGLKGNDVLHGESGDDVLIGGQGADILKGGDGDDILIGDNAAEEKAPTSVPIGEDLIVNGSFENHGDLNRGSWGTFDKIEGWQTSAGSIEIQEGKHGGTPGAAEGDSVLELDAHEGRDTNATVFQDIKTGTEGTFKLSFSFSAREIGSASNTAASNTTEVYWGSEKVATISADQKGWESYEYELNVNPDGDELTRLEFRGTGTDDGIGGLIDSVSVMRIK